MQTYIALNKLTPKGTDAIQDTVKRSENFVKLAKSMNVEIKTIYWSGGPYDTIAILEAQNDTAMMAFSLAVKKAGFFTSEAMRVFNKSEMGDVLSNLGEMK